MELKQSNVEHTSAHAHIPAYKKWGKTFHDMDPNAMLFHVLTACHWMSEEYNSLWRGNSISWKSVPTNFSHSMTLSLYLFLYCHIRILPNFSGIEETTRAVETKVSNKFLPFYLSLSLSLSLKSNLALLISFI